MKLFFKKNEAMKNTTFEDLETEEGAENEETLTALLAEPHLFGRKSRIQEGGEPEVEFEIYYGYFPTATAETTILAVAVDADGRVLAKEWDGSHEAEENKSTVDDKVLSRWLGEAIDMGVMRLRRRSAPPRSGARRSYNIPSSCRSGSFV